MPSGSAVAVLIFVIIGAGLIAVTIRIQRKPLRRGDSYRHGDDTVTGTAEHPAYGIQVGMPRAEVIKRLGPQSGAGVTMGTQEFFLYKNTPAGHDTRLVVDRGKVDSVEIDPHPDNTTGVARTLVSKPGRRRPMAERWASDPQSILSNEDAMARALAEFAETVSIEFRELDLTEEQKWKTLDTDALDETLDESDPPEWMITPVAIRRIGHHLNTHGGFSTMQRVALLAGRKTEFRSVVSIVDRLWDGIGGWEK